MRRAFKPGRTGPSRAPWTGWWLIPALVILCLGLGLFWQAPPRLFLVYGGMSALSFLVYAMDKAAATRGAWRVSERTLHTLALLGGWPGAWVAQQVLRHKTAKPTFRAAFGATVVINVLGLIALCSPLGRPWLNQVTWLN